MCSYAPLFAHLDGWQWTPDLIWYDNLKSFGTPNYYVQWLFSNNKGTEVLNMLLDNKPLTGQNGLYATAAWDNTTRELILKVVNSSNKPVTQEIMLNTAKKLASTGKVTTLKSDQLNSVNSLDQLAIKPNEKDIIIKGKMLILSVDPYSVNVFRIAQK
jgi:alpha-L-arabinofuranosidase